MRVQWHVRALHLGPAATILPTAQAFYLSMSSSTITNWLTLFGSVVLADGCRAFLLKASQSGGKLVRVKQARPKIPTSVISTMTSYATFSERNRYRKSIMTKQVFSGLGWK